MNKVQVKRLLNVAKALRESKTPKKFSMRKYVWGEDGAITHKYDENYNRIGSENKEVNFCGTPACALGHYASRPDLQKLLKVKIEKTSYWGVPVAEMVDANGSFTHYADDDVKAHFGITEQESEQLFGVRGCGGAKTTKDAAKFIEKFVAQKLTPPTRRRV